MTFKATLAAVGFVLCLTGGGALAQNATVSNGQEPPAEQAAAEKPPEKPKCVNNNSGFKEKGKTATFEVELENSCDERLKCTVDAFVTGARGQAQGHGTLILPAAPKGQTTRKTYEMKIKSAGGMANVSHSCKSI